MFETSQLVGTTTVQPTSSQTTNQSSLVNYQLAETWVVGSKAREIVNMEGRGLYSAGNTLFQQLGRTVFNGKMRELQLNIRTRK